MAAQQTQSKLKICKTVHNQLCSHNESLQLENLATHFHHEYPFATILCLPDGDIPFNLFVHNTEDRVCTISPL